jgi:hypothetical protein
MQAVKAAEGCKAKVEKLRGIVLPIRPNQLKVPRRRAKQLADNSKPNKRSQKKCVTFHQHLLCVRNS